MFHERCVLWLRGWNTWNKQHNNTEAEVDAVNQPAFGDARQTGVSLTGWISKVLFKLQLGVPILVLFLSSDTDLMCEGPILLLYSDGPKKHQSGGAIASNCIFFAGKLCVRRSGATAFVTLKWLLAAAWTVVLWLLPTISRFAVYFEHFTTHCTAL